MQRFTPSRRRARTLARVFLLLFAFSAPAFAASPERAGQLPAELPPGAHCGLSSCSEQPAAALFDALGFGTAALAAGWRARRPTPRAR